MNKSNHRSPFAIVRRISVLVKPIMTAMLAASVLHPYQLALLHRRRCADRGLPDRVYRRQETVLVLVIITVRNKTSHSFEWEVLCYNNAS